MPKSYKGIHNFLEAYGKTLRIKPPWKDKPNRSDDV